MIVEMEIMWDVIKVIVFLFGLLCYLAFGAIAVWITCFKKTWQRIAAFIASMLVTPLLFMLICLPIQYWLEKKNTWLK